MHSLVEELGIERSVLMTKKRELAQNVQISSYRTDDGEELELLLAQISLMEAYIQVLSLRIRALNNNNG